MGRVSRIAIQPVLVAESLISRALIPRVWATFSSLPSFNLFRNIQLNVISNLFLGIPSLRFVRGFSTAVTFAFLDLSIVAYISLLK